MQKVCSDCGCLEKEDHFKCLSSQSRPSYCKDSGFRHSREYQGCKSADDRGEKTRRMTTQSMARLKGQAMMTGPGEVQILISKLDWECKVIDNGPMQMMQVSAMQGTLR